MFWQKNKNMLIGAGVVCLLWVILHYTMVNSSWTTAAENTESAKGAKSTWEKSAFDVKDKAIGMTKPKALEALADSNKKLESNLKELQKIEFGSPTSLQKFTLVAAGTGDPNNYLATLRRDVNAKVSKLNLTAPTDFNIDKEAADPVPLNLMRLAIIDRFLTVMDDSKTPELIKVEYFKPVLIPVPENLTVAVPEAPKSKGSAPKPKSGSGWGAPTSSSPKEDVKEKEKAEVGRLIQIPVKIQVRCKERTLGQLLSAVQLPGADGKGYLRLWGIQVSVKDSSSGLVDAVLGVAAVLQEKDAQTMKIEYKEPDERGQYR